MTACGGTPTQPPVTPPVTPPPQNALPSISSITVQGRRPKQPPRFADAREVIDVSAAVSDAETPVDELTYEWTAPVGTFSGTGRNVTWTAPETVSAPTDVTITLKVVEQYGHPGQPKNFAQNVSSTQTLSLHDSVKEVGDYSREFLIDFSTTSIPAAYNASNYWQYIMRNFKAAACPRPDEIEEEKKDVIHHYTFFNMQNYEISPAAVSVRFGGSCPYAGKLGDACAAVPVYWDSIDTRNNSRGPTRGVDHISAAYSVADSRWWLCSSYFQPTTTLTGHSSYWR